MNTTTTTEEAMPPTTEPQPTQTPAKRGRPRKAATSSSTSEQPAAPASVADVLAGAADAGATPAPKGAGRPSNDERARAGLASSLADSYRALGGMLTGMAMLGSLMPGDAQPAIARAGAVGQALMENADRCGNALAAWADKNPKVRKALQSASSGAGLLVVLAAHAPIIAAAFGKPQGVGDLAAGLLGGQVGTADPTDFLAGIVGGFIS